MGTHFLTHVQIHVLGENATYPIAPPWRMLAALLLLAGISPLPRHACPAHPMPVDSGMFNGGFRDR